MRKPLILAVTAGAAVAAMLVTGWSRSRQARKSPESLEQPDPR